MKKVVAIVLLMLLFSSAYAQNEIYGLWDLSFDMTKEEVEAYLIDEKGLDVEIWLASVRLKEGYTFPIMGFECENLKFTSGQNTIDLDFSFADLKMFKDWHKSLSYSFSQKYATPDYMDVELYQINGWDRTLEKDIHMKRQRFYFKDEYDYQKFDVVSLMTDWRYFN